MQTTKQQSELVSENEATVSDEGPRRRPYEAPVVVSSEGRPLHALLGSQAACGDTTGGTGGFGCEQV